MRFGLACDGAAPPEGLIELLVAAGLPAARLGDAAGPALVPCGEVQWVLACGADVLTGCRHGAVDVAVVGKDLLLESRPDVYELLDLRVECDRLVYAVAERDSRSARRRPRVATRYPRVARSHFDADGRQVETLTMAAARLAPALGLAEGVVELERVLAPDECGLLVREQVAPCSARLVAGRAARALLGGRLADLVERLSTLVEEA